VDPCNTRVSCSISVQFQLHRIVWTAFPKWHACAPSPQPLGFLSIWVEPKHVFKGDVLAWENLLGIWDIGGILLIPRNIF